MDTTEADLTALHKTQTFWVAEGLELLGHLALVWPNKILEAPNIVNWASRSLNSHCFSIYLNPSYTWYTDSLFWSGLPGYHMKQSKRRAIAFYSLLSGVLGMLLNTLDYFNSKSQVTKLLSTGCTK